MDKRWSIFVDVEGFSRSWGTGSKGLRRLGALMEGIYRIGTGCFPDPSDRMFAHQIGDGFIIVGDFGADSLERPIAIAAALMRFVLIEVGGMAKAAVAEGDFGDYRSCYPACIQDHADKNGAIGLGSGLMTIFTVMGGALIESYKVKRAAPSGSLLAVPAALLEKVPPEIRTQRIANTPIAVVDWIHMESPIIKKIERTCSFRSLNSEILSSRVTKYCENEDASDIWKNNTQFYMFE